MDNFHIDVTCEGKNALRLTLDLACAQHHKVTHYAVRPASEGKLWPSAEGVEVKWPLKAEWQTPPKPHRLVFMWTGSGKDSVALPFALDAEGACDFAWRWLAEQDYGREPDHDGHNGKGWRAYCEAWGHVDGEYAGFIAISPAWAMYGK